MTDLVNRLRKDAKRLRDNARHNNMAHRHVVYIQDEAADRIEELEAKLISERNNALDCLSPHCEEHTGENTPPFAEWAELMKNRCPICDAELQRKYDALAEGVNNLPTWFIHNGEPAKRNPKATIPGAFVKLGDLRALLEDE